MGTSFALQGTVSVHPRGFGFLDGEGPSGPVSAFVTPPDLNPFVDGDVVSATVTEGEPGRFTAKGLTLVRRTRETLFGSLVTHGKRRFLRVDRLVSNTDWPVDGDLVTQLDEGTWVVARLVDGKLQALRALLGGVDVALERVCARHGLRTDFDDALLAEAAKAAGRPLQGHRRDLRAMPTVTIDGPSTRDIDDALAVLPAESDGALRVFVSIADVDAYVPHGSPLDLEARARGTSVYLAGRTIPMLPDALSAEAISLNEGQDKLAVTVELRLDAEGTIAAVDVYESIIKNHARLTYDAVAAYLQRGEVGAIPEGVLPTLRWLRTAAARLSIFRAARGGIELLGEEATVTFDAGSNEPTAVAVARESEAHRLVERLMVAANEAVGRWLHDRGLPGVYRVHDPPAPERVQNLAQFARNFGFEPGFSQSLSPKGLAAFEAQYRSSKLAPALRTVMGRVLGPARYTVTPALHFGLAAPLYVHFTSPIRRYADLCVHRVIKRFIAGDRAFGGDFSSLEAVSSSLNDQAYAAAKAESESVRMMVARLFAGRVGERVTGNVVAIKPFGLVAQIVGTGVTGTVALDALAGGPFTVDLARYAVVGAGHRYAIGDSLDLVIAGTNEELGRIELTPR